MKPRCSLIVSLALNLALAAAAIVLGRAVSVPSIVPPLARSTENVSRATTVENASAPPTATIISNATFNWSLIESDDYRQYVSNLRAVGCPEQTIRDIIVADLDDLYQAKTNFATGIAPPWQNADGRRAQNRERAAKIAALRAEKRALVKELIGYEWDNHVSEEWHEDFMTSLLLGFLPDPKPLQLMAIAKDYREQADDVKTAANHILIDEDRAQLRTLYGKFTSETSQLISPAERDELELRIQAMEFLAGENINLEGIALSGAELREYIRLSRSYEDLVENSFVSAPQPSEAELAAAKAAFDQQVEKLFGPQRFAEYQRRQDTRYRESCTFARQHQLGEAAGLNVFNVRRAAEDHAAQVKADTSLSADARAYTLAVLRSNASDKIKSVLGDAYDDYLTGPGHWLDKLEPKPKGSVP